MAVMDKSPTEGDLSRLLREEDLSRLLEEYVDYQAKWQDIGCFLKISPGVLEVIERDNRGKSGDCFREVLLEWLKNQKNPRESQLQQAVEKIKITTVEKTAAPIIIAVIAILLAIVVLALPSPLPTGTVSGPSNNTPYGFFNATIQTLKELYREH